MKKISLLTVILFTIFNFVAINSSIVKAQVSQAWVCPAGFTCTPISAPSVPVACPAGFTCVPTVVNNRSSYNSSPSPSPSTSPAVLSCPLLTTNLKIGDISNDVSLLHDFLIAKGYSFPSINSGANPKNYFGIETLGAVMKYQKSIGVSDTGFVGPMTRAVINGSCNNNAGSVTSTSNLPVIYSLTPSKSGIDTSVVIYGANLSGTSNIEFRRANGQLEASLPPSSVSSNKVVFFVNKIFANNVASGTYKVSVVTNACRGGCDSNRVDFTLDNQSQTSSSSVNNQIVSAELLNVFIDRAGSWKNFKPGSGNFNKNNGDWNWVLNLRLGSTKTISRITIKHNTYGEVWSTGYSRYLKDGTDLYEYKENPYPIVVSYFGNQNGYKENPYPIVVSYNGNQINSDYDQVLGTYQPGDHKLILNGQPESERFTGAQIIIEFSDGTKTSGVIAGSSFTQPKCPVGFKCSDSVTTSSSVNLSPSPTITPTITPASLMVSINSPRQGDTWSIGETKTISWNYNNLDSTIYGNKYVDVLLVPSDGREPVKLGTNISAPSNSLPVKIYEKTSDGRSAWLSGNYKIRVVCQNTNAARFNSCYGESASFKVISPSPSPSATVGATVR